MPAAMPENSTRGSSALIRITSWRGMKLRRIETTRILNGSGFTPRNTVHASPTIPDFTSESGMIAGAGGTDRVERGCSEGRVTLAGWGPGTPVALGTPPAGAATARPLNPRTNKEADTDLMRFT